MHKQHATVHGSHGQNRKPDKDCPAPLEMNHPSSLRQRPVNLLYKDRRPGTGPPTLSGDVTPQCSIEGFVGTINLSSGQRAETMDNPHSVEK